MTFAIGATLGIVRSSTPFGRPRRGSKRGDIRALGALSYATPLLSTALLIAFGLARPTGTLFTAAVPVTARAVLASRDLWSPAGRR